MTILFHDAERGAMDNDQGRALNAVRALSYGESPVNAETVADYLTAAASIYKTDKVSKTKAKQLLKELKDEELVESVGKGEFKAVEP